ncbi:MAG: cupin domain-containing protein [Anaerolineae bacterium]|nr:cupin domain-containing protein [Anaerolineae bacterium]
MTLSAPIVCNAATDGARMTTAEPFVRNVTVLLSPFLQQGLEDFAVGCTEVPAGQQGSRHNHPEAAEVWLFFAGVGKAIVDDVEYDTAPGTVVYTPAGTYHQFINTGSETVKLYYMFAPSGPEKTVIDGLFK